MRDFTDAERAILQGRKPEFCSGRYVIVPSDYEEQRHTHFRVVNLETGAESALYSYLVCGAIIVHAQAEELKGSFDITGIHV
jgi:hypothetical protein